MLTESYKFSLKKQVGTFSHFMGLWNKYINYSLATYSGKHSEWVKTYITIFSKLWYENWKIIEITINEQHPFVASLTFIIVLLDKV